MNAAPTLRPAAAERRAPPRVAAADCPSDEHARRLGDAERNHQGERHQAHRDLMARERWGSEQSHEHPDQSEAPVLELELHTDRQAEAEHTDERLTSEHVTAQWAEIRSEHGPAEGRHPDRHEEAAHAGRPTCADSAQSGRAPVAIDQDPVQQNVGPVSDDDCRDDRCDTAKRLQRLAEHEVYVERQDPREGCAGVARGDLRDVWGLAKQGKDRLDGKEAESGNDRQPRGEEEPALHAPRDPLGVRRPYGLRDHGVEREEHAEAEDRHADEIQTSECDAR